jgi:hypothetical protein
MLNLAAANIYHKNPFFPSSILTSDGHSDHLRMSSEAGFVTKNGNLSAKALKRISKDGVTPKKLAKRQKVAKAKPIETQEEEHEEIPVSKTFE